MNKFVFILVLVFCIGLVSASSVSVWQGQYYTGTTFNTGTYTFNFSVYDAETGGSMCFTNTTTLTTGNWGEWRTEQSPWSSCNNASKDYFLNININGADQVPRRRLTVSDFLRRDVSAIHSGNIFVSDNVTANYFFGLLNASYIMNAPWVTSASADTNASTACSDTEVLLGNGSCYNSTLFFDDTDTTYSHLSNFTDDILWTTAFNSTGDSRWSGGMDTQKNASGYLYNDSTTIYLNETILNATIDDRSSGLGDNSSWNESYADGKYILQTDEGNLNVNSSVYSNSSSWWSGLSSWVSGWFVNNGGNFEFNESKLNATIDLRSSGGDNSSWNQSLADSLYAPIGYGDDWNKTYADTLYAPIGVGGDNSSWNESYADTKYLNLSGRNSNQNLNISPYNFTVNWFFGNINASSVQNAPWVTSAGSQWNITGSNYLVNVSNILSVNETRLNNTISSRGVVLGFNSTYNATYAAKADYQFLNNNFNGSGNFNTTGNIKSTNISVSNVILNQDPVNHRIYDNSSCIIIRGDTSTMYIC